MSSLRTVAVAVTWIVQLSLLSPTLAAVGAGVSSPSVEILRVPNGGTHPQARTDSKGRVHLIYAKGDPARCDIFYVRSEDGGKSFSPSIQVNSHPESVIITGTVRGPQLAIGKGDRVHVAWMGSDKAQPRAVAAHSPAAGKAGPRTATPMLYARMNDEGNGYERQRNLIQQHPGLDGGGSIAADAAGNVYVAWHAPGGPEESHAEQDRGVWLTRSRDDGRTFDTERRIDPTPAGVCACCGMRVFADGSGRVFVLYRVADQMVNRGMRLLVSADQGERFEVAAHDPWEIGQCVMSTSAFALGPKSTVFAAWETKKQIHFALLGEGPEPTAKVSAAPGTGSNRKHPAVALNDKGEALLAWTEDTGWNKGGTLVWQVFDHLGRPVEGRSGKRAGLPVWSVPAVVVGPDGSFTVIY